MSVINTNVTALYSQNALKTNARAQSTAMEQLSSGTRVNSAKDDAAGLAIGQNMTSQVRGLNQAVRNLNDGVNMMQTAEGAMIEQTNMLQRMRELAVQAMNGTYSDVQRGYLDKEFQALSVQIGKIATDTKWNDQTLLDATQRQDGVTSGTFKYQAGMASGQTVIVTIKAMNHVGLQLVATSTLGTLSAAVTLIATGTTINGYTYYDGRAASAAVYNSPAIGTEAVATATLALVGTALEKINSQRAELGAAINRMQYAGDNLSNISANTAQSRSSIMDTDYALASTQLSKTQIVQQAATAMLAQANQQPQAVLSLLKQ